MTLSTWNYAKIFRNHFNGAAVDQHVPFVQSCVNELCDHLEKLAKENNGEVDFLNEFVKPLTFLVTAHVTGLSFENESEKQTRIQQAGDAIKLINLLATDEDKLKALESHDKLMAYVQKQLEDFVQKLESDSRTDCLLYDFAKNVAGKRRQKAALLCRNYRWLISSWPWCHRKLYL